MDATLADYHNSLVNIYSDRDPPQLADITARFRKGIIELNTIFQSRAVSMARPCTATNDTECWITSHLTLWNQILNPIATELIEDSPCRLSLHSLQMRFNEIFSHDLILQSCIAVHWLMKHHHCISKIHIIDYDFINNYTPLFCNALSVSKAVRELHLSSYDFDDDYGPELAAAVGNMAYLQKLDIHDILLSDDSLGAIGYAVGSRNTLVGLHLWANSQWTESGAAFLDGAKSCTNLKDLRVRVESLGMDGAGSLSDMLRDNPALEKVGIEGVQFTNDEMHIITEGLNAAPLLKLDTLEITKCSVHASALAILADALQQHRMLTILRVTDCELDCAKVRALVRVLKDCASLRELCFDTNRIKDGGAIALSKYLGAAKKLQVLSVRQNCVMSSGAITLIEAVLQQTKKLHLYLGHIKVDNTEALELSRTLEADGASERVQITYNTAAIFQLGRVLRMNRYFVEEIIFEKELVLTPEHMRELFEALLYDLHVRKLAIDLGTFDDACAEQLCSLLSTNSTLQYLGLGMELQTSHMILLFNGLAKNGCISELVLNEARFDRESANAFAAMLKVNKVLNRFNRFVGDLVTLRILGAGMSFNYTLLDIGLQPECVDSIVVFDIEEVRRRNHAMLNKAVKFALMVSTTRELAVAFERVRYGLSFLLHLRQYGKLSEDDARNCTRWASRYIAVWFLLLSGVVKEKLECHQTGANVVQIDQLSTECLEKVFSYVRLDDIAQL